MSARLLPLRRRPCQRHCHAAGCLTCAQSARRRVGFHSGPLGLASRFSQRAPAFNGVFSRFAPPPSPCCWPHSDGTTPPRGRVISRPAPNIAETGQRTGQLVPANEDLNDCRALPTCWRVASPPDGLLNAARQLSAQLLAHKMPAPAPHGFEPAHSLTSPGLNLGWPRESIFLRVKPLMTRREAATSAATKIVEMLLEREHLLPWLIGRSGL